MKRMTVVVLVAVVVGLGGCVDADPVAPSVCAPVDTLQAGPYTAAVCVTTT